MMRQTSEQHSFSEKKISYVVKMIDKNFLFCQKIKEILNIVVIAHRNSSADYVYHSLIEIRQICHM
jgi:hypothetical protein